MLLLEEHCVKVIVVLGFFSLGCIGGQGVGPCPKLDYMKNFNVSEFTGRWYEIEHSFYLMELIKSCISFDLIENDKGRIEISVNTKSTMSGRLSINGGVASASKKDPSLFIYKVSSPLPRVINKYLPGAGLYQVLHTDYKDYAIVYSCTNFHVLYIDFIWIWGRRTEIGAETRAEIYSLLDSYDIDSERLILSKNDNCTDY